MATVLKRRHGLRSAKKVPLVKRLRREVAQVAGALARLSRDVRTEEMTDENLKKAIKQITGEEAADLMELAGKIGVLLSSLRGSMSVLWRRMDYGGGLLNVEGRIIKMMMMMLVVLLL